MNERLQDFELLQRFARGEQVAFNSLVRRHLDLVFATALRKVEDEGAAQEVAQNVFADLARKAWRFAPDDSLPAWLHKAALVESTSWLRGELRRRRREQTAAELGTTMNTFENPAALQALMPLLDDALLSLREKERTALLLRFYEKQSLRDVGAAFGVSEDTAQKRVQNALEKLTDFFKRRGFKTATVAATAAVLQHTAVSTSASLVGSIIGAVLPGAPVALSGLAALLARLASLTTVQTAGLCVALAAVPAAWQLNEGRVAGRELKRIETQLVAGQSDAANLESEIERLRATFGSLEQSVAQANETAARAAADAQAFADWKQRIRSPLLVADYRWSDNSPFVRIPKAVLPDLMKESAAEPFSPPGVVNPFARELMVLTPAEHQAMEAALQRHFPGMESAWMQETNLPLSAGIVARKSFVLQPPPDDQMKPRRDVMLTEARGIVGDERGPLVEAKPPEGGPRVSYSSLPMRSSESLEIWVNNDDKGTLKVGGNFSTGTASVSNYSMNVAGYVNAELSAFLPEGDPNRTAGSEHFLGAVSNTMRQRALAWLQEQALARLGKKEQP